MSGERKHWRYLPARRVETLEAEIERLTAEVNRLAAQDLACALEGYRLRAERDAIDAMHHPVPSGKDDEVCNNCGCFWPCRTHLLLHPEEARREQ